MTEQFERESCYDLLKGTGIILVLYGHFIEPYRSISPIFNIIFILIYSFHMPLFCFLSGLVAEFRLKSLIRYGVVYGSAQMLYTIFRYIVLNEKITSIKSLLKMIVLPFWHMWYLYAMLFWLMTIPIIKWALKYVNRILIFILVFIFGLLAGYNDLPYSLMRVVVFYVFFLGGYLSKIDFMVWIRRAKKIKWVKELAIIITAAIFACLCIKARYINVKIFFNLHSYIKGNYSIEDRIGVYILGWILIINIFIIFADYRNTVLEKLGKRTLPVFILHAFCFWTLDKLGVNTYLAEQRNMTVIFLYTCFITIICIILFSCKIFRRILRIKY